MSRPTQVLLLLALLAAPMLASAHRAHGHHARHVEGRRLRHKDHVVALGNVGAKTGQPMDTYLGSVAKTSVNEEDDEKDTDDDSDDASDDDKDEKDDDKDDDKDDESDDDKGKEQEGAINLAAKEGGDKDEKEDK